ncbi:MAG: hypothetical protein JXR96_27445 [Deltaproteobacteria bacterium]|nr:hypothetical protein [Deltaproteobacteria bacterium]
MLSLQSLPIAASLHGWLSEMDWYRDMLDAGWFQSVKPYWIRYHLEWVAAGLLVLILLFLIYKLTGAARASARRGSADSRTARRLADETAHAYLAQGEKRLAAQAFVEAGDLDAGLQIYEELEAWAAAADLCERMDDCDKAVDYYKRARDIGGATRVLIEAGRIDEAAAICCADGRAVDGAKLFEQAGRAEEAARLFAEAGLFAKAARLMSESGQPRAAAEHLLQLIASAHAGFTEDEVDQLREGAATLNKMGRVQESAEMLKAAGEFEGAALRFRKSGDIQQAVACFERSGKLRRALEICQNPEKRLQLLREMEKRGQPVSREEMSAALLDAGYTDEATSQLESSGDVEMAVRANLASGRLHDAADLLAKDGQHLRAAETLDEAGDPRAAREEYLLAGEPLLAAQAAARAGMHFEAGRELLELGETLEAVGALQQVDEAHTDYRHAASLLGVAFASLNDRPMALRMHDRACGDLRVGRDNLELFYNRARFLDESDDPAERRLAREIYGQILEVHYTYKDVKRRHDRLAQDAGEGL